METVSSLQPQFSSCGAPLVMTAMIIEGLDNTKCRRGILVQIVREKQITYEYVLTN
jgi:hypothetical protein